MFNSNNVLVSACISSASRNANSLPNIGYFGNTYGITFFR